MGLKRGLEKLFGAGEFATAKKTTDRLNEKKKLIGRDKKDKRAAEEILQERRTFLKQALAVTATLTLGSYLAIGNREKFGCLPEKEDKNGTPHTTNDNLSYVPTENYENIPSGAQMRGTFNRGFENVFKDVPENLQEAQKEGLQMLSAIKVFRKKMAKWAELRGRSFVALESGQKNSGWMVVLNPSNPRYHTQKNAVQIDASSPDGIVALLIKPHQITETWAAIVLTHELVHLHDMVLGFEPRKPSREQYLEGEKRAYFIEKMLVDHITGGRYSKAVQEFIKKNDLSSIEDVRRYLNTHRELSFKELNDVISSEPPKSHVEVGLRQGFSNIVVSIEVAVKAARANGEKPNLNNILAKVLSRNAGGDHIPKQ